MKLFYNIVLFYCLYTTWWFLFIFSILNFFFIDQFFLGIISSFLNFFLNKRWLYLLFLAFVVSKMKKEKHAVVIICRYILNINFLLNISLTGAYKLCCFMFAIYKIFFLIVCLVSYFEVCVYIILVYLLPLFHSFLASFHCGR